MTGQLLFGIAIIPTIAGIVQVSKQAGLPTHLAPMLALLLGILAGLAQAQGSSSPWIQAVALGCTLGLSASGLYSGAQTISQKLSPQTDRTGPPGSVARNSPDHPNLAP
jgi:hypothetical protein